MVSSKLQLPLYIYFREPFSFLSFSPPIVTDFNFRALRSCGHACFFFIIKLKAMMIKHELLN